MKPGLSGYTCVRDSIRLDYCVDLTIQSLLDAGCDEVVVGMAESTDGTETWLHRLFDTEPRVRLILQPWPNPNGQIDWWVKWINATREHLRYDTQLMLDADEVLDVDGFKQVLADQQAMPCPVKFLRLNYWRDARHLIPHGRCCSHLVTRYGPSCLYMPSDEQYGDQPNQLPGPEPEIRLMAMRHPHAKIFHLGFLRKREALFAKVEGNIKAWFGGTQDTRLVQAAADPTRHWTDYCEFDLPLDTFNGPWPDLIVPWLKERNAL